jgi:hypothetical protein
MGCSTLTFSSLSPLSLPPSLLGPCAVAWDIYFQETRQGGGEGASVCEREEKKVRNGIERRWMRGDQNCSNIHSVECSRGTDLLVFTYLIFKKILGVVHVWQHPKSGVSFLRSLLMRDKWRARHTSLMGGHLSCQCSLHPSPFIRLCTC